MFALLPLAGGSGTAHAQVSAEVLEPAPARAGWSGGGEARLVWFRGNTDLLDVGGAARVRYETIYPADSPPNSDASAPPPFVRHRCLVHGSGHFSETHGNPFVNEAFAHARWTAMWHPRVGTDLFVQYQHAQFRRIRARAIAGTGVRIDVVHRRRIMLWGGSGYLFEYDLVDVAPGADDAPQQLFHRWVSYLSVRVSLFRDRLLLQNTVYIQPRFDRFSDFRFLDDLETMANVAPHLALGWNLAVLYNSAPPTKVVSTDVRMTAFVRLSW